MSSRALPERTRETANDRFKRGFDDWLWGSMSAAVALHFAVFQLWPSMTATADDFTMDELTSIDIPEEIELPPPPETIARPAQPVIADTEIDEDITIASTDFESNPPEMLPPPRADTAADLRSQPIFMPFEVAPKLLNEAAVARELSLRYPPLLRDARIGGVVRVLFFIDETGEVIDRRVETSSGYETMDQAALSVADMMEFTPAQNRDKNVPVWISWELTFRVN